MSNRIIYSSMLFLGSRSIFIVALVLFFYSLGRKLSILPTNINIIRSFQQSLDQKLSESSSSVGFQTIQTVFTRLLSDPAKSMVLRSIVISRHRTTTACLHLLGITKPLELNTSLCKKYCELVSRRYHCTGCSIRC